MTKSTTFTTSRDTGPRQRGPVARDWRCQKCFKLLGRHGEGGVHVNFARGHQYIVSTPVTAVCRSCGTLNKT